MQLKNALVTLALVAISASVYAQNTAPPSPAAILLRERSSLQLSNAQVRQLEDLDKRYSNSARPVEERMMKTRAADRRLRAREKELTPAEKQQLSRDSTALRRDARELSTLRRQNRDAAMKVLTPAQRTKAEQMLKERASERRGTSGKPGKKAPAHKGSTLNSILELLPH
jgi:hypothetical protein